MDELLVEMGAQPSQLLLVAQLGRFDRFVEPGCEDLIVELRRQVGQRPIGP